MNLYKWFLFALFLLMLVAASKTFWRDVFSFVKNSLSRSPTNTDGTKTNSPGFGTEGKTKTYLHPLLTELNNRTRWYSTELWHVAFAYIGITAVAIGQTIDKKLDFIPYMFAASAVLGIFVVWHMTRLRRSEQRNIRNLARVEEELGVPKPNQAKTNPLPKPFQFAIIAVVIFYGLMASITINGEKAGSVLNDTVEMEKQMKQTDANISPPDSSESSTSKDFKR